MTKDHFKLGEAPFIEVKTCGGDLIVRGWAEQGVQIRGDYLVQETEKGIQIESTGSLRLDVPRDTLLSIDRVKGNLNIKQFTGSVSCEYTHGDALFSQTSDAKLGIVHGDLVARNLIGHLDVNEVNGDVVLRVAGGATFGAIHGDLSARVIEGGVVIGTINGDADLRTISGEVDIRQGFRDINLATIGGQLTVAGVTGDIRLRGGLASGNHSLDARGDIVVRWPPNLPLNLSVSSDRIDNRLHLVDVVEKSSSLVGRLGEGETFLALTTAGRVVLREEESAGEKWSMEGDDMEFNMGVNMDDIASRIEAEVNSHISRVTREMESKFGAEFSQRINEKLNRKVEKANERMRRRADQRGRSATFDSGFAATETPAKIVSTEEQLRILKMVETGKITPDEASMLLEALEE